MIKLFQKIFAPKPQVTMRPLVTREYIQSRLAGVDLVRVSDDCATNIELDIRNEAEFLCARLRELEGDLVDGDTANDFYGHVVPPLARLENLLAKKPWTKPKYRKLD